MSFLLDGVGMLSHARMLVSVLVAVLAIVLQALEMINGFDEISSTYRNVTAESSANIGASLVHLTYFAILKERVNLNALRKF